VIKDVLNLVFEQMPVSVILQLILYKTPVKTDYVSSLD